MIPTFRCLVFALAVFAAAGAAARDFEVVTRPNIAFAQRDGASLAGDLYLPKGLDKAPVIVAVHGGGWQGGQPRRLQILGAVPGAKRLRAVLDRLSARQAGYLSGQRL